MAYKGIMAQGTDFAALLNGHESSTIMRLHSRAMTHLEQATGIAISEQLSI